MEDLPNQTTERRPRWRTDSLGGSADAGTELENDCLSSPLQRVLLGSASDADIYCFRGATVMVLLRAFVVAWASVDRCDLLLAVAGCVTA